MNKIKIFFKKPIIPMILGYIIIALGASLVLQATKWMWITGIVALILGILLVLFIAITQKDLLSRNKI